MLEKYDHIGVDYNLTRHADPYITKHLYHHLNAETNQSYLDIGCGTGNYTNALHYKGLNFIGIDPSKEMLSIAELKNSDILWKYGKAELIPLDNKSVIGCLASLTIHHWESLDKSFKEIYRVLKLCGKLVIFTSTPQQMKGYWLNHYFPKMLKDSILQMPSIESVQKTLAINGFKNITTEAYFVQPDLVDLFLYAGKERPQLYLNPQVRQSISSFSDLAHKDEVEHGLNLLKQDIASGKIESIKDSFKNNYGDYLFVTATT